MTFEATSVDLNQYVADINSWRKKREHDLRAPDGWLTLTGLFELRDGEQTIGSDDASNIVLPKSAPAHLGTIVFNDNRATLHVTSDAPILVDGKPVREAALADNNGGDSTPTLVTTGTVSFFVHKYGNRYGIRIKDSASPTLHNFAGCSWFEVKPDYHVRGKYVPHAAPHTLQIDTTVGAVAEYKSPGVVEFELHSQQLRLLVTSRTGNKLSLIFRDATSGIDTYPAVRFLSVEIDDANNADIEMDFNKAYNPPCAFTPYATCPLPPRENVLAVPIAAGETYDNAH